MEVVKLDNFETGNPFWHDSISCGMDLRDATTNKKLKGVYVMSNSFMAGFDFYIVNSKNGERIGIKL